MKRRTKQQQGFTVTQMLIVIAIIGVVSTFGVMGIRTARAEFRLQSSARLFASYVEKARADSVRRHATTGSQAYVETFGAGTSNYAIRMDFGNGLETRTFQLDSGIDFETAALKVTFDWRGRLLAPCPGTKSCVYQVRSVFLDKKVPVDVSGSGDITVDSQHFPDGLITSVDLVAVNNGDVIPEPAPSTSPSIQVSPNPDPIDPVDSATPTPSPTATPHNGNGSPPDNGNNGNGNGNQNPSPSPSLSPSPSPSASVQLPQCAASISPDTIELSQSISTKRSGTATFTMVDASGVRIISAKQDGGGNSLDIEVGLLRIDGSGSSQIKVTAKNGSGNRGTFGVKVLVDPACGSQPTLTVIVKN